MPLDHASLSAPQRAAALNTRWGQLSALGVLSRSLSDPLVGRVALVSSFGADSVVLLHLVSLIEPDLPVLFVDTEMLFEETLTYQQSLTRHLGLRDVRHIRPARSDLLEGDVDGILHVFDQNACCDLRKRRPLDAALSGFDTWITGRKRHQNRDRRDLQLFEADGGARLKINPLANWSPADVSRYIDDHALPRHPLVARGFSSLGCQPCTTPTRPGEDPRAGRWRGSRKTECGIHFPAPKAEHKP